MVGGFDTDESHHSVILMLQEMTVVDEIADGIRIAEIQAQSDTRIDQRPAVIVRDVHRVAEKRLIHRPSQIVEKHEMQLMNVKCM